MAMIFNPFMHQARQVPLHHQGQHGNHLATQSLAAGPMGGNGRSVAFAASPQPVGGAPRVAPAWTRRPQIYQPQYNNHTVGLFSATARPYNWVVNLVAGKSLSAT